MNKLNIIHCLFDHKTHGRQTKDRLCLLRGKRRHREVRHREVRNREVRDREVRDSPQSPYSIGRSLKQI